MILKTSVLLFLQDSVQGKVVHGNSFLKQAKRDVCVFVFFQKIVECIIYYCLHFVVNKYTKQNVYFTSVLIMTYWHIFFNNALGVKFSDEALIRNTREVALYCGLGMALRESYIWGACSEIFRKWVFFKLNNLVTFQANTSSKVKSYKFVSLLTVIREKF